MRHSVSGSALLAALTMIQGCSVSETLTPPLDVGTSGSISSSGALTRSDIQTAMEQNQTVYTAPVRDPAPEQTYAAPPQQMESAQSSPQNSLDAQAQALQSGYNPVASTPLEQSSARHESQRPQVSNRQPVEKRQTAQQQPLPPHQQADEEQADAEVQSQQATVDPAPESQEQASIAPVSASPNTIRFLPIIGAPAQVVMPLSRQLGVEAREKGLVLRDSSGEPAQHILKGYFSAYGDGNRIVVVYVWDVLDASGNRLHRIQGQEAVPGKAKDPWASVPASTMQIIATKTMEAYQEWQSKSTG